MRAISDSAETAEDSFSRVVQDSRAGDQFHHVWAALQSLKLLNTSSGLQAVWVEGAAGDPISGDEIIDVAEYYGPGRQAVSRVLVRQLKYSTRKANTGLGLADVGPTLRKFAKIDARSGDAFRVPAGADVSYSVVTNKPINNALATAVRSIAAGEPIRPRSIAQKVLQWLELKPDAAALLCSRIEFISEGGALTALRGRLAAETSGLAGGRVPGSSAQLIDAVARRASGDATGPITLPDVTAAFETTPADLFPAPPMLDTTRAVVHRPAYDDLARRVLASAEPLIITADGGVGKSTFASRLPIILSSRAHVVVYDCFGEGEYRTPTHPRHRHRDGLVQIVSELAGQGLCAPLVPSPWTEASDYLKAFTERITEAATRLQEINPPRELVILIDAADNAATAAESRAERTFVTDLVHFPTIDHVHLVLTCRPHRLRLLDPPRRVAVATLPAFAEKESAEMLRAFFPAASDPDVVEFHQRTFGNPRVQAYALTNRLSLEQCLAFLAGITDEDGDALTHLLTYNLNNILDAAGRDRATLEFLGQLLATLRPPIPLPVLSVLAGADPGLIRGFVSDLERGLLIQEETLRFLDEPTETFFRDRYPLDPGTTGQLLDRLTTLSETNAYAAAALPQVLWESGRYPELMALAGTEVALPNTGEVERRQIARLRTEFMLRAAVALQRPADVVQTAMLAGSVAASSERRYTVLRDAADLTGEFLDGMTIDEAREGKLFPSNWPGAAFGAEAVMLAMNENRQGEARARLRAAISAMTAWARTRPPDRARQVTAPQIAQIALAIVFLDGPQQAASFLARFAARWAMESAGHIAAVLLSRGDAEVLQALASALPNVSVNVAVAAEQQRLGQPMTSQQTQIAWDSLQGEAAEFGVNEYELHRTEDAVFRGIAWIAASAVTHTHASEDEAVGLLEKYLPPKPPSDLADSPSRERTGLLLAYALRAQLQRLSLDVQDLAPEPSEGRRRPHSDEREQDRRRLQDIAPWIEQWARWSLGRATDQATASLLKSFPASVTRSPHQHLLRHIAGPIAAQLARDSASATVRDLFEGLLESAATHSTIPDATTMVAIASGVTRWAKPAYACLRANADRAVHLAQPADEMAADLIQLARAAHLFDQGEAQAYFERAVEVASKVGPDAWDQWESVVAVAGAAGAEDYREAFALATHLSLTAQAIEPHMGDGLNYAALVNAFTAIAGGGALAIVSRWRDRRFGAFEWMAMTLAEGYLAAHPQFAIALAPFSERIPISPHIVELEHASELTDARFSAARTVAWARGEDLDANALGADLASRFAIPSGNEPLPEEDSGIRSSWTEEPRRRKDPLAAIRAKLARAHLTDPGTVSTLLKTLDTRDEMQLLVDDMSTRPENEWAPVVRNVLAATTATPRQQGLFVEAASKLSSNSLAFPRALKELAADYLKNDATNIVIGHYSSGGLDNLARVFSSSPRDVLLDALNHADAAVIVSSTESCYRLARTLARLVTPTEGALVLSAILHRLDEALGVGAPPDVATATSDTTDAVAAFLWAALADPRARIRWQAMHAVRFLVEFGDPAFSRALNAVALGGAPVGFTDPRFPFYEMHAVEALFTAFERVARDDPAAVRPHLPTIRALQGRYPDHARMQHICAEIGKLMGEPALTQAAITMLPPVIVSFADMPRAPKPHSHGAPRAEVSFGLDGDEYWIAPVSEAFPVEHADVLNDASAVVLDEWGWRDNPWFEHDPRHELEGYGQDKTYLYKDTVPDAEDLDFYLMYHAAFTVAGRLARKHAPYREHDADQTKFARWFSRLDLARQDRRWISDNRRPYPSGVGHVPYHSGAWRWQVKAADFPSVFLGTDGWVTVHQWAQNVSYRARENVVVKSALVSHDTAQALIRALQTSRPLVDYVIPSSDSSRDIQEEPFVLRGWVVDNDFGEQGADARDTFASDIRATAPQPAAWVLDTLGLEETADGLQWTTPGDPAPLARADLWASKRGGGDERGVEGYRLRVSSDFLRVLTERTDSAFILSVRIDRDEEPDRRRDTDKDDDIGALDDYVRFFLYTPSDGWRDYLGRPVSR
ncbi:hypothetical protein DEA06_08315 [Microbacterium sp. Gd 4-13]|uniref:hypothetical protein n=1 Tax=Microbacterium sp. Gd 4-13 TaxID=2173179 RepID=UPI000D575CBF|nr:hypothetical protein [Microbacterium sp. Gd 4-13]PVW04768.1 hypothetical protein DEA06_08315 [Microbacterium sp. Gd 4-13]